MRLKKLKSIFSYGFDFLEEFTRLTMKKVKEGLALKEIYDVKDFHKKFPQLEIMAHEASQSLGRDLEMDGFSFYHCLIHKATGKPSLADISYVKRDPMTEITEEFFDVTIYINTDKTITLIDSKFNKE